MRAQASPQYIVRADAWSACALNNLDGRCCTCGRARALRCVDRPSGSAVPMAACSAAASACSPPAACEYWHRLPASWEACASQQCRPPLLTAPWADCAADADADACATSRCPARTLSLTSVTPAVGDRRGGSRVTIHGAGFARGVAVRVGGALVSAYPEDTPEDTHAQCTLVSVGGGGACVWECGQYNFSWVSPRELRVSLPAANATAYVLLRVTNGGGSASPTAEAELPEAVFMTSDCPVEGLFGMGGDCRNCSAHARCPGGHRMWAEPGYWAPTEQSGQAPQPHLHRGWAHPSCNCAEAGLTPATSAPGLGSPQPHLHRGCAHAEHANTQSEAARQCRSTACGLQPARPGTEFRRGVECIYQRRACVHPHSPCRAPGRWRAHARPPAGMRRYA